MELCDLSLAAKTIKPITMKEITLSIPSVRWTDIGGQWETKKRLQESIQFPLQHPEMFRKLGITPPKGILLYGPPGCSKTMMAKALATESSLNFLAVKGPELFQKWVGESERAIKEIFSKARLASPSIIFFDEIDAIGVKRGGFGGGAGQSGGTSSVGDRVLTQLLTELDGIEPLVNVTIVAATNRPDILDPALLRPGRIDRLLYVGLPDAQARHSIFSLQLSRIPHDADVDASILVRKSEGMSGAEVVAVCQEAALAAMEEDPQNVEVVCMRHFLSILSTMKPRITDQMIQFYHDFERGLKRA